MKYINRKFILSLVMATSMATMDLKAMEGNEDDKAIPLAPRASASEIVQANYQHNKDNSILYAVPNDVLPLILHYMLQTDADFTDVNRLAVAPTPESTNAFRQMQGVCELYEELKLMGRALYLGLVRMEASGTIEGNYLRRLTRKSLESQYALSALVPAAPAGFQPFPEDMFLRHFHLITDTGDLNPEGVAKFKRTYGSYFKAWLSTRFEFIFTPEYRQQQQNITNVTAGNVNLQNYTFPPAMNIRLVPVEIRGMQSLTRLNLHNVGLTIFPTDVTELPNLEVLDLSQNSLTVVPAEIGKLTRLTGLSLSRNMIGALPEEIGDLRRLRNLDLFCNLLKTLPSSIGNLRQLGYGYPGPISGGVLAGMPAGMGMPPMPMPAGGNQGMPPAGMEWINSYTWNPMFALDLSRNKLESLPPELANLTGITTLCLAHNRLTTLPLELKKLKNLSVLDLNDNKFSELPDVLGSFARTLIHIDLSNNPYVSLPLDRLASLKDLGEDMLAPLGKHVVKNSRMMFLLEATVKARDTSAMMPIQVYPGNSMSGVISGRDFHKAFHAVRDNPQHPGPGNNIGNCNWCATRK